MNANSLCFRLADLFVFNHVSKLKLTLNFKWMKQSLTGSGNIRHCVPHVILRSARLQEMKGGSGGPSLQGGSDPEKEAAKASQMEEMRSNMLLQILNNDARERCKSFTD